MITKKMNTGTKNSKKRINMIAEIGQFIHDKRLEQGKPLKEVADFLNINISLLSKIEHGERQIQGYMLKGICDLFDLDYKTLQIEYIQQKIEIEFGDEPYLHEALANYIAADHY